ncbi:HTH-type transcriptional regulator CynR [Roseovarius albus]|uniref:HTH-type transcriptional regulator CynR n=1 Tax=Roseovarius albus TaxID=1247867 RepID=A0A1X7A3N6_9RHOB|nr:LysR family transcriptional regulator [Roseovarius albus]SLN69637.1 HTH-type transcriptional regulator CynR [Roseovarius albus]
MNRQLLHTYMDVLETRNFNRTSERLNITQSTVSARIRQLEEELGTRLFERGRGGAEPTAAGRRFETHCRSLLAAWSLAKRDVSIGGGQTRPRLRISVQFSLAQSILVDWAKQIRAQVPRLDLYLESNFAQQIQRDILTGETDIGIVFASQHYPDVHVAEFGSEYYVMLSTDCDNLLEVNWLRYIKVAYTPYFDRQHDEIFPNLARVQTVVGSDNIAVRFLKTDGGTAFFPGLAVPALLETVPGLKRVQGAPVIPQPLYSIVHSRKRNDPLVTQAVSLIRKLIQDHTIDKFD